MLVGIDTADDAGVFKLNDELAIVQTVDFFTPIVDDPYLFGQIAAVNSLSDVWAMGGTPVTALAIACLPVKEVGAEVCGEMMRGGVDMLTSVGVALVGGHSVEDTQLKFGYAVTGVVHPAKIITNAGAKPGDRLVFTKKLGTGIIGSGIKFEKASKEAYDAAIGSMLETNRIAGEVMQLIGVNAATDVTGFGFLGHAYEVAKASNVTLSIDSGSVPVMPQVFELYQQGIKTKGDRSNREYVGDGIIFDEGVSSGMRAVLFDPQTSGGMLIAVEESKYEELIATLQMRSVNAALVGQVLPNDGKYLHIY